MFLFWKMIQVTQVLYRFNQRIEKQNFCLTGLKQRITVDLFNPVRQKFCFSILWCETTVQNLCFSDNFPEQKHEKMNQVVRNSESQSTFLIHWNMNQELVVCLPKPVKMYFVRTRKASVRTDWGARHATLHDVVWVVGVVSAHGNKNGTDEPVSGRKSQTESFARCVRVLLKVFNPLSLDQKWYKNAENRPHFGQNRQLGGLIVLLENYPSWVGPSMWYGLGATKV